MGRSLTTDGILNIYKEAGYTSHDVVARLRGILHMKKIGHTGTLDPMAEGVLPVCVGNATKLCESLSDHDKEYEAVMILGRTYDTLDVTGELIGTSEVMSTEGEIIRTAKSFIGGYDQVPPMYSAKKINGQKLYDIARSGKTVERRPVFVNIYDIEIISVDLPRVRMRISCGKGTYIRSLIDDIGRKLGCGAAMEELTRTKVGEFVIESAYKLSRIEEAAKEEKISDVIISLESVFSHLGKIQADQELSKLLQNGNTIPYKAVARLGQSDSRPENGTRFRMYDSNNCFLGVYEYKIAGDIYKPYKMFLG